MSTDRLDDFRQDDDEDDGAPIRRMLEAAFAAGRPAVLPAGKYRMHLEKEPPTE